MGEQRPCARCGAEIPEDAPAGGLCPRCLMREGLEPDGATRTGAASAGGFTPPVPQELAARFPGLEILELIGQGGMGAVYRARQVKLDRLVALKILDTSAARGPLFAERFMREARTLARVSHPNIVAVHDFGEAAGQYYFLMEYVDGANLREVMRAGKLSPSEALAIVPQICDALQYAHEEGVVHRDIKPENILLDRRGRVKIADFGLAKILLPDQRDLTLTVPGQVMGTPAYMAPEQIEKPAAVDHRADIYSLGVVFYEMLTGELPLGRFGPPSSKVQVDVRLDEVVLRTLEKEPERRYQHADDVKTDVESLGEVRGDATPSAPPPVGPEASPPGGGAAVSARAAAPEASWSGAGGPPDAPVPTPPPEGFRRVDVRRPRGVSWVAAYCIGLMGLGLLVISPSPFFWFFDFAGFEWFSVPGLWGSGGRGGLLARVFGGTLVSGVAVWSIVVGIGLLRLRRWARMHAVAIALIGIAFYFPLGAILSIFVLVYLLRRDVTRLFELGEGPATLAEEDARALERVLS